MDEKTEIIHSLIEVLKIVSAKYDANCNNSRSKEEVMSLINVFINRATKVLELSN